MVSNNRVTHYKFLLLSCGRSNTSLGFTKTQPDWFQDFLSLSLGLEKWRYFGVASHFLLPHIQEKKRWALTPHFKIVTELATVLVGFFCFCLRPPWAQEVSSTNHGIGDEMKIEISEGRNVPQLSGDYVWA